MFHNNENSPIDEKRDFHLQTMHFIYMNTADANQFQWHFWKYHQIIGANKQSIQTVLLNVCHLYQICLFFCILNRYSNDTWTEISTLKRTI